MKEAVDQRSRIMRAVKSKDTTPELVVRCAVHGMGYRYRLHCNDLPGKPDLVFPSRRKAIFVNGCFWHGHNCARGARIPKANREYWKSKIARNRCRDEDAMRKLTSMGWAVFTIWECELKEPAVAMSRVSSFLKTSNDV